MEQNTHVPDGVLLRFSVGTSKGQHCFFSYVLISETFSSEKKM